MNKEQIEQVKNWIIKQNDLVYIEEEKDSLEIVQVEENKREKIMTMFFSENVQKITTALEFFDVNWFFHINYEKHLTVHVY